VNILFRSDWFLSQSTWLAQGYRQESFKYFSPLLDSMCC